MKKFGPDTIPRVGELALLTVRDVGPDSRPMVADFRDHLAVFFKPAGLFIGLDGAGDMRLGGRTPKMRDGVWYIPVDPGAGSRWKDIVLSVEDLELRPID